MAGGTVDELIAAVRGAQLLNRAEDHVARAFYASEAADPGKAEPVRATVIRDLCRHASLVAGGHSSGLRISNALVQGELDLSGIDIDFPIGLVDCNLQDIRLRDTRLVSLQMSGSKCGAIRGDRLHVAHDLVMSAGFVARLHVWLPSVSIAGDLNLSGGQFRGRTHALLLDGVRVGGRIYMREENGRPFCAKGPVLLRSARIGNAVFCTGGIFERQLELTRATIDGELNLGGAQLCGFVHLNSMNVTSDVVIENAAVGSELKLERSRIAGSLVIADSAVRGSLLGRGLRVSGDVNLAGSMFDGERLTFAHARVVGAFTWRHMTRSALRPKPVINLLHSRVGYLDDQPDGWPGSLRMEGFSFEGVAGRADWRWLRKRKKWLNQQPRKSWSAHPYDQLRAALRDSGQESAARSIAVNRENMRLLHGKLSPPARFLTSMYGLFLGYGYRVLRFFVIAAVIVAFLGSKFNSELKACDPPTKPPTCGDFITPKAEAPEFDGWLYSADAFIPVDLKQVSAWTPRERKWERLAAFEIALGWIATALLIGAVTGVLRRD